jgi:hypothetical protein
MRCDPQIASVSDSSGNREGDFSMSRAPATTGCLGLNQAVFGGAATCNSLCSAIRVELSLGIDVRLCRALSGLALDAIFS